MTESFKYDSPKMRTVQRGITLLFYGLILSAAVFTPWLSALAINNVSGWETNELSLMMAAAQTSLLPPSVCRRIYWQSYLFLWNDDMRDWFK